MFAIIVVFFFVGLWTLAPPAAGQTSDHCPGFKEVPVASVKPGFCAGLFADDTREARQLAASSQGTVYVGTRAYQTTILALRDTDGDGVADSRHEIGSGLRSPNGVAIHNGNLFVAENDRILRFDRIEDNLESPPEPAVIAVADKMTAFPPTCAGHAEKYIAFGPDGNLYMPVGMPVDLSLGELADGGRCSLFRHNLGTILRIAVDSDPVRYEVVA